jgi:hypothetical protein
MKASAILSIPLPPDLYQLVVSASSETKLSRTEVMRQSLRIGLPLLVKALSHGEGTGQTAPKASRAKRASAA